MNPQRPSQVFFSRLTHELRTPLSALLGLTELLSQTPLNTQQADLVSKMQRTGHNLLELVNDLLDAGRIDSGALRLEPVPIDVTELLNNLRAICVPWAVARGIEFYFDVAVDVPRRIVADPLRLTQIVTNLVSNAIKFTEKGWVLLELGVICDRAGRPLLQIRVRDSGIGMDEAQCARLFQDFSQGEGIVTRFGGSGLGMAITDSLVKAMDGKITVSSRPGLGSTFTVILPLTLVGGEHVFESIPRLAGNALIIDENKVGRALLAVMLDHLHIASIGVSNIQEAITLLDEMPHLRAELNYVFLADGHSAAALEEACMLLRHHADMNSRLYVITHPGRQWDDSLVAVDGRLEKPLDFPVLAAQLRGDVPPPSQTPTRSTPILHGKTVLVVEDQMVLRELLCHWLTEEGASCQAVASLAQAEAVLSHVAPDWIFLDRHLPDGDSLPRLPHWLSRFAVGTVPHVVLCTANPEQKEKEAAFAAGACAFLPKPFTPLQLRHCLEHPHVPTPPPMAVVPRQMKQGTVEAINLGEALRFSGGKLPLARRMIALFASHHQHSVERLLDALQQQDYVEISRIAHRLRGAAGSIGAVELHRIASQFEGVALQTLPEDVLRHRVLQLCDALSAVNHAAEDMAEQDFASA